jgi:DNA-directed RNA polymerase subunit RPC12/RpoP
MTTNPYRCALCARIIYDIPTNPYRCAPYARIIYDIPTNPYRCELCARIIYDIPTHAVDVAEPTEIRADLRPVCDDCYVEVRL